MRRNSMKVSVGKRLSPTGLFCRQTDNTSHARLISAATGKVPQTILNRVFSCRTRAQVHLAFHDVGWVTVPNRTPPVRGGWPLLIRQTDVVGGDLVGVLPCTLNRGITSKSMACMI